MSNKQELWKISDDFSSHMRLLDILRSTGEDTAPIEKIIAEYFTHEVTRDKIDSVIGYIRERETIRSAAINEILRLQQLRDSCNTQIDWLKDTVKGVLEMSGQKRLEGLTAGSLTLRANGGRQAVQITDASLVPEEYVQYTGTISGAAWSELFGGQGYVLGADLNKWLGRQDVQMERIPHKGRIGEALSKKCATCKGSGRIEVAESFADVCRNCDGDGLARVPGARLEPRGSSVILK